MKRATREDSKVAISDPQATAGAPEIVRIVKGWITELRDRRRTQASMKLTTKVIVGSVLLSFCCGAHPSLFVAAKSASRNVTQTSLIAEMGKLKAEEQHVVLVEHLRVHYIEKGVGQAVVMIHGNAGGVEDFQFGAMERLAREYRVVAIDRPGHGSSDRPAAQAATIAYQAQLLHQTLSQLGITQPILVGHSWGAALALAYVLRYPDQVSGMVLLAPAVYPDNGCNRLLHATLGIPILGGVALTIGKSLVGRSILRRELTRAFYPQAVPESYSQLATSWLGRKQLKSYFEDEWELNDSLKKISTRYSEISIPVAVVTGDEDRIVSARDNAYRLHAAIPHSRLLALKDTGHEIPQTHPESIAAALNLIAPTSANEDTRHPDAR